MADSAIASLVIRLLEQMPADVRMDSAQACLDALWEWYSEVWGRSGICPERLPAARARRQLESQIKLVSLIEEQFRAAVRSSELGSVGCLVVFQRVREKLESQREWVP